MPVFDAGARGQERVHDRVLTVPNAISALRLIGLPLFVWLVLGRGYLAAAFWTLVAIAATDWVDGFVARRFDQVSRVGKVLDPLIDRVLLASAGITLLLAGIVPWWVVALVVGRDVVLLAGAFLLFGGLPPIRVSRTGKLATAALLAALPTYLVAAIDWAGAGVAAITAWACVAVGLAAYYVAAAQYARLALRLRATR